MTRALNLFLFFSLTIITSIFGSEKDDTQFTLQNTAPDIKHTIIEDLLSISATDRLTLEIKRNTEENNLSEEYWSILRKISFEGLNNFLHLSEINKAFYNLTENIRENLKIPYSLIDKLGALDGQEQITFLEEHWDGLKGITFLTEESKKASSHFIKGLEKFIQLKKAQDDADQKFSKNKDKIITINKDGTLSINLSGYSLKMLPSQIFDKEYAPCITNIDLGKGKGDIRNEILFLPNNIKKLKKLENLSLYFNKLSSLPKEIGELTNLKKLFLHGNLFEYFPKALPKSLELLDIAACALKTICEESISRLVNLEHLHVYRNSLTSFPGGIRNLKKLIYLRALYNDLDQASQQMLQDIKIQNPLHEIYF